MLQRVAPIEFPAPTGINVNMMPIVPGDPDSVPEYLRGYLGVMAGQFLTNKVAYLTVHESVVETGQTQRRPGIHTDGTMNLSWGGLGTPWGGGLPLPPPPVPAEPPPPLVAPTPIWAPTPWGGGPSPWGGFSIKQDVPLKHSAGIFMASSDGRCRAWDLTTMNVDSHGSVLSPLPEDKAELMGPSTLYWMTDRTPHESLPSLSRHYRQFYRLVSEEVGVWFSRHSTPNPLGVLPTCRITDADKFAALRATNLS